MEIDFVDTICFDAKGVITSYLSSKEGSNLCKVLNSSILLILSLFRQASCARSEELLPNYNSSQFPRLLQKFQVFREFYGCSPSREGYKRS